MLRIDSDYLAVLRDMRPVLAVLEARDIDLARQLRRAASSVALTRSGRSPALLDGVHGGLRSAQVTK